MKTKFRLPKKTRYFLYTLLCTVLFTSSVWTQITLEPSKGDRFSYFLNGNIWKTSITIKSEFALKVYSSKNLGKYVWILNFSLKEKEFIALMEFIDSLDKTNVGNKTHSSKGDSDVWFLSSFVIYGHNYYTVPANEVSPPDLDYLMKHIRIYFQK